MRRALALVAAAALTMPACGRFTTADGPEDASPEATKAYGEGTDLDGSSGTVAPTPTTAGTPTDLADPLPVQAADEPGTGSTDITVVDTEGGARRGIAVQFDGPVKGTAVSDDDGHLRVRVPSGRYRLTALVGCRGQLLVERGGTANVGVADGQTARGDLVVEVALRFEPAGPVSYSGDAGWRVGESHRVRFRLTDVCETDGPPSPADYGAARFATNEAVEVVAPLSDDVAPDGTVEVTLRCTGPDEDVTLDVADAVNPRWARSVLTGALLAEQRPPFCLA